MDMIKDYRRNKRILNQIMKIWNKEQQPSLEVPADDPEKHLNKPDAHHEPQVARAKIFYIGNPQL